MMKKGCNRVLSLALVLALLTGLLCLPASAAEAPAAKDPSAVAAVSRNEGQQNYSRWSDVIRSYLYEREDGNLTRVEATSNGVAVEVYDSDYQLLTSRTIPMELSLFGGFWCGEDANYLVFGAENRGMSNSQEVYRIVKYSKNWERLGQASLKGANTTVPFDAGTLRFAEAKGMLYILTCHEMYTSSDGLNHQANVTIAVRERDMTITDAWYDVMNIGMGYCSHSFNQFIVVDGQGNIVTLNHGDAYPRGSVLFRHPAKAGAEKIINYSNYQVNMPFQGKVGENSTGASLGGFAASSTSYLTALNTVVQDSSVLSHKTRNVYVIANRLGSLETTATTQITNYPEGGDRNSYTPQLVDLGGDRFLVMWQIQDAKATDNAGIIGYAIVNGEGKLQGQVREVSGKISDCQPIVVNGKVVWYVTNSSKPVFYALNPDRGTIARRNSDPTVSSFPDVAVTSWAFPYVEKAAGNGWMKGTGDGKFSPAATLSNSEFAALLVRVLYPDDASAMDGAAVWYAPYVEKMTREGLWAGSTMAADPSAATKPMSRYDMAQVIYNVLKVNNALPSATETAAAKGKIGDFATIPASYAEGVAACYAAQILNGTGDTGAFSGTGTMTREQAAKVICAIVDTLGME